MLDVHRPIWSVALRRRVDAGPDAGGVPALDAVDMLFRLGQVRLAKRKGGGKKEEGSFHFPKSKKRVTEGRESLAQRQRKRCFKVLNLTFNVLYLSDAQMAGTGAVGFCDPETQTLGVVGSQSNDSMQDTFLHEVFHAIVHVMDLKETETEENYVRRLATGLCTVLNNNPKAFKWWSGLV